MKQVNSPDIQVLDYDVLMDISTANPSVTLTNQSVATSPANLDWVFEIFSPLGTPIYQGNFSSPDVDGAWSAPFVRNTGFPRPNNQLEWSNSGNPYRVIVYVKDSQGKINSYPKDIPVCRPSGNTTKSQNTYGKGVLRLVTKCHLARLWVEDATNFLYQGISGTLVSKSFKLIFPPDETGTPPAPQTFSFNNSLSIPIAQSGDNYHYFYTAVRNYNFGNRVTVRVKYLANERFPIRCNVDLTPIACELKRLMDDIDNGTCRDASAARRTIEQVSPKLHIATIGILHPQSGIDPFEIVEQINKLTGWQCDCCSGGMNALGILDEASGISYDIIPEGGDVDGEVTIAGDTVQIRLHDLSYAIALHPQNDSTAITIDNVVAGNTKTYRIKISKATLADEILGQFESNTSFKNRLSVLLAATVAAGSVSVDKGCIAIAGAPAGDTNNYSFVTTRAFAGGETMLLKYFTVKGNIRYVNLVFDGTNAAAIKTALDALGIGTWTVNYASSLLTISSTNNGNDITALVGHFSGDASNVDHFFTMSRTKTNTFTYPVQDVLQGIINFVCNQTLTALKLGQPLTVKQLQAVGGAIDPVELTANTLLAEFFIKFVGAFNQLVDVVRNLKQLDCTVLNGLFTPDTNVVDDTDVFMAKSGTKCVTFSPLLVAQKIFDLASKNQVAKDALCVAVSNCTKAVCAPVTAAAATYNAGTQVLSVDITNVPGGRFRVGYRLKGTKPISGTENINAAVGAVTTKTWSSITPGQYEVVIVTLCADGSESSPFVAETLACAMPASLTAVRVGNNFSITVGALPTNAAKFRIEIAFPNGGNFAQNYATGTSMPLLIPIPGGIYGDFLIQSRTVCHEANAWYSDPTPAVRIAVAAPASCPTITKREVLGLTSTTATIRGTKPVGGTVPGSYKLILRPAGGIPREIISSTAGLVVDFPLTGLTPNLLHGYEIISLCEGGESLPYNGGSFTTPPSTANNSSITNNTDSGATSTGIKLNGSTVFVSGIIPPAGNTPFVLPDYGNASIDVSICGINDLLSAQIVSNGITYNSYAREGDTFKFVNVNVQGGIQVSFDD